jgi:hypothetical protein
MKKCPGCGETDVEDGAIFLDESVDGQCYRCFRLTPTSTDAKRFVWQPSLGGTGVCKWCGATPQLLDQMTAEARRKHNEACRAEFDTFCATFQAAERGEFLPVFEYLVGQLGCAVSPVRTSEARCSSASFRTDRTVAVMSHGSEHHTDCGLLDAAVRADGHFDESASLVLQLVLLSGATITDSARKGAGASTHEYWRRAREVVTAILDACTVSARDRTDAWPRVRHALKNVSSEAEARASVASLFVAGCTKAKSPDVAGFCLKMRLC